MDMEQESEWNAAQSISISENLLAAAKRQLQFLAVVDKNRWLYEGQALQWAIYRYNACWLPLLAKHSESRITEGPLVVPLDCEWVWHCHRLNPVRYKSDCEELYVKILDNCNVVSSVEGISKTETEEIWSKLYPNEPYEFDMTRALSTEFSEAIYKNKSFSKYDFTLAIERQSPFFYQVSRPHAKSDLFLEAAVARYKGFLHLIRRNREKSLKRFCVPTYDIDLIWHTHQLHPASYCKDLTELLGKVLEHDDTDQNRAKGQKLDTGFSETTKQWEETFGSRYWRAGAMYRGTAPSPVTTTPCIPPEVTISKSDSTNGFLKLFDGPKASYIEVILEFVDIKNLPESHKGKVNVLFSKAQPDGIFDVKRKLSIQSELGQKQVAIFQCQPSGHLLFELVSQSAKAISIGSCYISMEEFFGPINILSVEKWLDLVPSSGLVSSEPISLRVAVSCSLPIPAPRVVQMLQTSRITRTSCFFPLPGVSRVAKSWTCIVDTAGDEIIRLQMRKLKRTKGIDDKSVTKEISGITKAGETIVVAQFVGKEWSLLDSLWSLKPENNNKDSDLLLTGPHMVKLITGRKLDFEPKHVHKQTNEHDFMTAVEFSSNHPYGKAVALIDLKSGLLTLQEDWFAGAGVVSGFIASKQRKNMMRV